MSIVPNFLITGILAMLLSVALIAWAGWFLQRRHGGWVQMALSILLLLFGGGFFPPMLALVGGLVGTQVNRTLRGQSGSFIRFTAKLWPWPLILLIVWLPVQFLLGDLLKALGVFGLLPIFILLPLSVYAAYAHDATSQA